MSLTTEGPATMVQITFIPYDRTHYHEDVEFKSENLHLFERDETARVMTFEEEAPYAPHEQVQIHQWFVDNYLQPHLAEYVYCTMQVLAPDRSSCIADSRDNGRED